MAGGQVQERNSELVDLLSADFQLRYEPNFAWKSICSHRLTLFSLRGFWPMSSVDEGGDAYDMSGQGRTLTYNAGEGGTVQYGYANLIPYFDANGDGYLERADEAGLDISGSETFITASLRGITMIAWVKFDNAASDYEYILSKRDAAAAGNTAYAIVRANTGVFRLVVSDGAAFENHESTDTLAANTWYHVAGRWSPSTQDALGAVYVNGEEDTAASALASLANIGANVQVAGRDDGAGGSTYNMDGKVCFVSLHAACLSTAMIRASYQQERAMFGV